ARQCRRTLPSCKDRAAASAHGGKLYVADVPAVLPVYRHLALDARDDCGCEVDLLEAAGDVEAARADAVDLHDAIGNDIESGEEDAVTLELGADDRRQLEHAIRYRGGPALAARSHVRAEVLACRHPAQRGVLAIHHQRLAIHHEEARIRAVPRQEL